MPGMDKKIQISAAESQVMEALWRKAPLTPDEIIAATASSQRPRPNSDQSRKTAALAAMIRATRRMGAVAP